MLLICLNIRSATCDRQSVFWTLCFLFFRQYFIKSKILQQPTNVHPLLKVLEEKRPPELSKVLKILRCKVMHHKGKMCPPKYDSLVQLTLEKSVNRCEYFFWHLHCIGDCVGQALTKSKRFNKGHLQLWHVRRVLYVAQEPVKRHSREQARKPRSYASSKLRLTYRLTYWRGWSVELLA